jgi:uncharacterized membrane protein
MAEDTRKTPPYHRVLFGAHSTPGVVLGAALLWFSFGSSLLPRDPMMQGVLGALSFTFGYALGVLIWFLIRSAVKLFGKPIPNDAGLTAFANEKFGPGDDTTLEGITQPTDSESSGSPDSLVQRDDLGFQGRTFTGSATTTEDLQTFPACSLNI